MRAVTPRDCCDDSRGIDLGNSPLPRLSQIEIAEGVGGETKESDSSFEDRAVFVPVVPCIRVGSDYTRQIDSSDSLAVILRHIDVAGQVQSDAQRMLEPGLNRRAPSPAKPPSPVPASVVTTPDVSILRIRCPPLSHLEVTRSVGRNVRRKSKGTRNGWNAFGGDLGSTHNCLDRVLRHSRSLSAWAGKQSA